MITSDFTGNFGNHIWQYAVIRSIAERKGFEWGFTNYIYGDYYNGKSQMDFLELDYGKTVNGICKDYKEKVTIINHIDSVGIHQYHDFNDLEDNSKLFGCWQTEQYLEKQKVQKWIKIKNIEQYKNLTTDEDTCVINVRGGEYKGISTVLLPISYWNNAISQMKNVNTNMNFLVITDDIPYAQFLFPHFPCLHLGINNDYYIINSAKYLILSNSSFAWFPSWLNKRSKLTIAPKYWARYNVSDGYWANNNIFTKGWMYLNREGHLESYNDIIKELKNSKYSYLYHLEDL